MPVKIKFMPYEKFKKNNNKSILRDLQSNTILLIDAKISPEEEAYIIEQTMKRISDKFTGVEMSSLELGEKNTNALKKLKNVLLEKILGKKRGLTIIGPAKIVRRIKRNPEELLVYM